MPHGTVGVGIPNMRRAACCAGVEEPSSASTSSKVARQSESLGAATGAVGAISTSTSREQLATPRGASRRDGAERRDEGRRVDARAELELLAGLGQIELGRPGKVRGVIGKGLGPGIRFGRCRRREPPRKSLRRARSRARERAARRRQHFAVELREEKLRAESRCACGRDRCDPAARSIGRSSLGHRRNRIRRSPRGAVRSRPRCAPRVPRDPARGRAGSPRGCSRIRDVALSPTTPQNAAGWRIEPPVSVPSDP